MPHAYAFSSASTSGLQANDAHKFADQHKAWLKSPEMETWLKDQEAKHEADPFGYEGRGLFPSDPVMEKPAANDLHPAFGKWDMNNAADKARVLGKDNAHALDYISKNGKFADHVKKHLGVNDTPAGGDVEKELAQLKFSPEHIQQLKNAVKGGLSNNQILELFPELTEDHLTRLKGK